MNEHPTPTDAAQAWIDNVLMHFIQDLEPGPRQILRHSLATEISLARLQGGDAMIQVLDTPPPSASAPEPLLRAGDPTEGAPALDINVDDGGGVHLG